MAEPRMSVAAVAGAPVITYVLTPQVSVVTTVAGDQRQYASVAINIGSITAWSTSLTQMSPVETLPYDASGMPPSQATVKKGATFTLTIPTTSQKGSVFAQMTIVTPQHPNGEDFAIQVAVWPLSG